ncbi:MAG: hypothetical protein AAGC85_20360 [Bacteroidota bacterium]
MKKLLFIPIVIGITIISCTNSVPPESEAGLVGKANALSSTDSLREGEGDISFASEKEEAAINFPAKFPLIYGLIKDDPQTLSLIEEYAAMLSDESTVEGDADILQLMETRDKSIIPALDPFIANMNEEVWYDQMDQFDEELSRLGIGMIVGEGMYAGLGPTTFMTANLRVKASSELQLYESFQDTRTISYSGEYPYMNMGSFMKLIQVGHELRQSGEGEEFAKLIEEDYRFALEVVTDIHMVEDQGSQSLLVGKTSTDFYPFAGDKMGIEKYLEEHEDFPFHVAVSKIVENPSVMTVRPENLYLLVTDWAETEEEAKENIYQYLSTGKDIPHYLTVVKGDGKEQIALVYRFYEDATAAEQAMQRCEEDSISAEAVMVSMKEGKLYQLGI